MGLYSVVQMVTTRTDCSVTYEVVLGDAMVGDRGYSVGVWQQEVFFGATDATVAGGAAFRDAAQTQQRIADDLFAALRGGAFDDALPCWDARFIETAQWVWMNRATSPNAISSGARQ